ncbi:hypothetical protein OGAPHI_002798 [Ogataea philodendri]|uniref:Thioredoxin-like fold domain-containing protein n=1 Tax=Ogataea philodendri TaxID=1378263 RepID=A0A9P8P909_9ASCO|nr:uncharacterized protein OGAPHI_002798 [Ogataea philodendri]KAH3667149.1 hypothetical protein OGAPHI_002798 [Ogataea philodendri]
MSIAPRFAHSHVLSPVSSSSNSIKSAVQLFLDYNCPFSKKLFNKINTEVIPLLEKKHIADKFDFVFFNVIQPWHYVGSGAYHEVALAVAKLYPDQFWKFSEILFDNRIDDSVTFNKTQKEVVGLAIDLAVKSLEGVDSKKLWELLTPAPDKGNGLQKDNKYFTRYQRTVGVHTTPTVLVDGITFGNIESSTPAEEIVKILEELLD